MNDCASVSKRIQSKIGPIAARNASPRTTVDLITQSRPVRPMHMLCTRRFHVAANSAANRNAAAAIARSGPVMATPARTRSTNTGIVPESWSAIGTKTKTSNHAANVLQIAIRIFAATSDAVVTGRVASKVVDELTAAATKTARNG